MERYFLGNNTAYGFIGNYEEELRTKDKVILLKGGPGTGKSTILKTVAKKAEEEGYDYELWYCSGDPKSLDGVYIKELNTAVVDATSPHATGADLPVLKDIIIDLAASLKRDKLTPFADDIKRLIYCKKHKFMRAYQHLKCALCNLQNQIALERDGVNEQDIRGIAAGVAGKLESGLVKAKAGVNRARKLFASAICPLGESIYFDHLKGKNVAKVVGSESAVQIFFDEIKGLLAGGMHILNPLEPKHIDGIVAGDFAVVKDVGLMNDYDVIDLREFEDIRHTKDVEEERNGVLVETALAVEELNKAREYHLELEKYFVGAMDFANNDALCEKIIRETFVD